MDIENPVFAFVVLAVWVAFAHYGLAKLPFFKKLITQSVTNKNPVFNSDIEGLRGILAISVIIHHASRSYMLLDTGSWYSTDFFYSALGSEPVRCFFAITAFLFWGQALRNGRLDPKTFLTKRCKRLYPAYGLAMLVLFSFVATITEFTLRVPFLDLLSQMGRWLFFGLPKGSFPDINGVANSMQILAMVTWTLTWEWLFYFFVLVASRVASVRFGLSMLPVTALILMVDESLIRSLFGDFATIMSHAKTPSRIFLGFFGPGIIAASLYHLKKWSSIREQIPIISVAVLSLFALGLKDATLAGVILVVMLLVSKKRFLHNFLNSGGIQCLGMTSYSIYLFHGFFLTGLRNTLSHLPPSTWQNSLSYWGLIGLLGIVILCCTALIFKYFEFPFIHSKKQLLEGNLDLSSRPTSNQTKSNDTAA